MNAPTRCPNCAAELTPGHGDAACVRVLRGRVDNYERERLRTSDYVMRYAGMVHALKYRLQAMKASRDLLAALRGDDHE